MSGLLILLPAFTPERPIKQSFLFEQTIYRVDFMGNPPKYYHIMANFKKVRHDNALTKIQFPSYK